MSRDKLFEAMAIGELAVRDTHHGDQMLYILEGEGYISVEASEEKDLAFWNVECLELTKEEIIDMLDFASYKYEEL
jgi:hypothetical protein